MSKGPVHLKMEFDAKPITDAITNVMLSIASKMGMTYEQLTAEFDRIGEGNMAFQQSTFRQTMLDEYRKRYPHMAAAWVNPQQDAYAHMVDGLDVQALGDEPRKIGVHPALGLGYGNYEKKT